MIATFTWLGCAAAAAMLAACAGRSLIVAAMDAAAIK